MHKAGSAYLQRHFVQLCECEDGFLHHVHAVVSQQHVQIGYQPKKELVVPFTEQDRKKTLTHLLTSLYAKHEMYSTEAAGVCLKLTMLPR